MNRLKQLIYEIHRRSIWQVLGIYLLASWAVLGGVDTFGGALNLPDWFLSVALALLIVGLPVVLATAFVQEGGPSRGAVNLDAVDSALLNAPVGASSLLTWRNAIVGGGVALGLAAVAAVVWGPVQIGGGGIPSIAVLPCENRSELPSDVYFTDGIHDDLLTELSKVPGLSVRGRTSVMEYRERMANNRTIGQELNVQFLVECGVQRAGDDVRITMQLIDAPTDSHVWSENYDRPLSVANIFAIQTEITERIASELQALLVPQDEAEMAAPPTESLEAYELTLQGRFHVNQLSQEAIEEAIRYFDEAIIQDPLYAPAYAGKAFAYAMLVNFEYLAPRVALPALQTAARTAIDLDPSLSQAHAWLGYSHVFYDWDWAAAEQEILTALRLNPNSVDAHLAYTVYLTTSGRMDEAVSQVRRAQEIDPKSIVVYSSASGVQATLYWARMYDESVEAGRTAVDLKPESPEAHVFLGLALARQGIFDEAIEEQEEGVRLSGGATLMKGLLAVTYAEAGRESEARTLLSEIEEASRQRYTCSYEIALTHATLGDRDTAFVWLEKAFEDRAMCIPWMNVDPRVDLLREDPRYQAFLDRVGFN